MHGEETVQVFAVVAAGGGEYGQRFRPELFLLFFQCAGNGVKGFFPACGGEFSFPASARAPQGGGQSVRGMDPLRRGMGLAAQAAPVLRSFRHARHAQQTAFLCKGIYGAVAARAAHAAPRGRHRAAFPFREAAGGLQRQGSRGGRGISGSSHRKFLSRCFGVVQKITLTAGGASATSHGGRPDADPQEAAPVARQREACGIESRMTTSRRMVMGMEGGEKRSNVTRNGTE